MEGALVEPFAERRFDLGAQRDELDVAVEVRRRLAGRAERVAFDFAARERRRVGDLAFQERLRLGGRDRAALQLRVEEGSGRAVQAHLQRAELTRGGHERQHERFGVERPALDVDRVERERGPREREFALEHAVELHFVAWPRFVRGEGPRHRVVGEIVGAFSRASARRRRDVERKDELTDLTGVADQRCGVHVRDRRFGALGERRDANSRRALGERDQTFPPDDRFDLGQPGTIERHDRIGIAVDLGSLERADHVTVVVRVDPELRGNPRRERLHLGLDRVERLVRAPGEFGRRDVDADVRKQPCVHVRRQAMVGARTREQFLADERSVRLALPLQQRERLLPTLQARGAQHLTDPGDQHRTEREHGAHFDVVRSREMRKVQPRARLFLGRPRQRNRPGLQARISAQPHEGQALAFDRVLLVEQHAQAEERDLRDVDQREQLRVGDREPGFDVGDAASHDLDVLAQPRIGLARGGRIERGVGSRGGSADAVAPADAQVGRVRVRLAQTHLRGAFRPCGDDEIHDGRGKLVAAQYPIRLHKLQLPTFQKSLTACAGFTPCRSLFQAFTFARQTMMCAGRTSPIRRSSCA